MSRSKTGKKKSQDPLRSKSEKPKVIVHLFPCGHGDTILVQYGQTGWSLIDCFLPAKDGTRNRFFEFVKVEKIRRLDFVFQTHPDYDHYHGMLEVVKYFTSESRSIGMYVDTGLNPRDIKTVFQNRLGRPEYEELQDYLKELHTNKVLRCGTICANPYTEFTPESALGTVDFLPIGPDPMVLRSALEEIIKRLQQNPSARTDVNALSLIIALECKASGKRFSGLLAADSDPKSTGQAIDLWAERATKGNHAANFDLVKVSHHGSLGSHNDRLLVRKGSPTFAGICCGLRPKLPDGEVIRQYLQSGWRVFATTTQHLRSRPNLFLELADRTRPSAANPQLHHVRISWSPNPRLDASPPQAEIQLQNIDSYESARI